MSDEDKISSNEPDQTHEKVVADPGFAPAAPTDGRELYEWGTKWPAQARAEMRCESSYLILFLIGPCIALALHLINKWCPVPEILGALAGLSGGSAFALKWFYHCVAKGLWHADRRYWRVITPLISGVIAFFAAILVRSDILNIFKAETFEKPSNVIILGFTAGYFSDSAIAKFAEVSASLFGKTSSNPTKSD